MASTKGLNEAVVKALPVPDKGNKLHFFAGAVVQGARVPRGFGVRVTANGAKAFVLDYRIRRRQYRYTIGTWPDWSALRAVREARELRQRVDRGENPLDDRAPSPSVKTIADVLDEFLYRYVSGKLRSAREYERAFARFVKPAIGKETIYDVRRSQVAEMLDRIEDESGAVMADRTLAYLRKAFNWYAARDDRARTKAALAAKKASGAKLGNPRAAEAAVKAHAANRAAADQFASNILPIVREIQAAGRTSLREIAATLNAREVRTARGGPWGSSSVRNLLIRALK